LENKHNQNNKKHSPQVNPSKLRFLM
jgi:hypothetical protein